jgi:beta-lactamase class A
MPKRFFLILVLFLTFFFGLFWFSFLRKSAVNEPYAKKTPCPYHNINPQRCEPELAVKKKEYVSLRNELLDYIQQQKDQGVVTSVSVYFRDLQNGPVLSINSQEDYIPASLLKLPLLLTYYKKAEEDPTLLQREITIPTDIQSLPQDIIPQKSAQPGGIYTIDELLTLLITQSDNIAWKALLEDLRKHYSEEDFIATLSDLGIVDPRKRSDQQYITAQTYAAVFRVLYNSSYLNIDMSDKALGILSQSDFSDGIAAGVPSGTQIAHKFGEQKNGEEQQLHDCGIVYYQPDPYIICIMTKGYTIDQLEPIIQHISQEVYNEVKSRNDSGQ